MKDVDRVISAFRKNAAAWQEALAPIPDRGMELIAQSRERLFRSRQLLARTRRMLGMTPHAGRDDGKIEG